jgi:hypothetical protein
MEEFNVDECLKDKSNYSTYDIIKLITSKVMFLCDKNEANAILTNANIAAVMQDSYSYSFSSPRIIDPTTNCYLLGTIGGIELYVDPYMRWDDNKMLFYKKNQVQESAIERIYSENDPYGEEIWGNEDKEKKFEGELLETLIIHDKIGILI